ncbi:hypothetical protein CL617_02050 [archaeon]|nr:hypothetical protein [archaeon]|tara:strand:- start:6059 stop:6850 length:792 start_codon:yes stop_codon:yes gene_type:complete
MKHRLDITIFLFLLFLVAHFVGLIIIDHYNVTEELPYNIEPPEVKEGGSFLPIFIVIIISTIAALVLIKFRALRLWKLWFFLSVLIALAIAFSTFMDSRIAFAIAFVLAAWKLFKPNVVIHNFTEVFIYGGLASIFVPILNLFSIIVLLILISVYDFISVYKTKHMVEMAKFQIKSKIFSGLNIPYQNKKATAILGGGDIGFTLLFSGVILIEFGKVEAIITSVIISLFLFGLFVMGKKNKFYPAMPVLTAGCLFALLIINLI